MWIDFMKAVIARTPVESFPTANAPKKALDVNTEENAEPAPSEEDPRTTMTMTTTAAAPAKRTAARGSAA